MKRLYKLVDEGVFHDIMAFERYKLGGLGLMRSVKFIIDDNMIVNFYRCGKDQSKIGYYKVITSNPFAPIKFYLLKELL